MSGGVGAPPDTIADGADLGAVSMRAASVRGLSHRYTGKPRQDSIGTAVTVAGDWLLVAVADGVSAADESATGSRTAVTVALRELEAGVTTRPDWFVDWAPVIHAASTAIWRQASHEHDDPDMTIEHARGLMASTLLVGAISLAPLGNSLYGGFFALVGDCSAMLRDTEGRWIPASPLKGHTDGRRDDLESAAVKGLPRPDPEIHTFSLGIRAGEALFLMSDGVGDPLGDDPVTVGGALAQWWAVPPAPIDFAAQVGFARRGYTDDRSVIGVWVAPEAEAAEDA
jgi:serine/threonine protein phosphatase PrpC